MALKNNITLASGISMPDGYTRIKRIEFIYLADSVDPSCIVTTESFKDENARTNNLEPITDKANTTHQVSIGITDGNTVRDIIYPLLKNLSEFDGAVDV